ncbi:hypothetical protein D3C80_2197830 [compost metagenome]
MGGNAHRAVGLNRHEVSHGRDVEQSVQVRPIGNRIRTVKHVFGFKCGVGNGAGVEVVPRESDRAF